MPKSPLATAAPSRKFIEKEFMSNEIGRLRSIAWRDLCPWLLLFRVFRLSVSMHVLFLATLAMLLTPAGWRVAEHFLTDMEVHAATRVDFDYDAFGGTDTDAFLHLLRDLRDWPWERTALRPLQTDDLLQTHRDGMLEIGSMFPHMAGPFAYLATRPVSLTQAAYLTAGSLWTLLVWALLGGAIVRIAVVRFGADERVGLAASLRFSASNLKGFFTAPLLPMLGALAMALGIIILGALMRLDIGAAIGGVLWFFVLLASLVMTIMLLGLLFGWPLMWGAMAAGKKDSFDAISRAYACTFQRPLHYLFYAGVVLLLGGLGWIAVLFFTETLLALSESAARAGAGGERWSEIMQANSDASAALAFGGLAVKTWELLVWAVAGSFRFSYFWCAAGAIYLLLRYDLYQHELDEVYLDEETSSRPLPKLDDAPKTEAPKTDEPSSPEKEQPPTPDHD